jgi:hypothetical protein
MAAKKSLSQTARSILLKESDDPTPDRDATKTTPNANTLHPGAGAAGGAEPSPMSNDAALIGDAPKSPGEGSNLGAAAAAPLGKDTSKSSGSPGSAEGFGLKEDEELDEEEIEMSEELNAFIEGLMAEGKSDDEIAEAIAENFEIVEEEGDAPADVSEATLAAVAKVKALSEEKLKEHVNALLEGENLSEDFRSKATTIFETAVNERLTEEVGVIEEAYKLALSEEIAQLTESLSQKVDDYLNYVVEQWVIENQVALDSGLRNELTEEFITGLRGLFVEHYIDVPEDKVDVVEQLGQSNEELKNKLNEEIARNVELTKTITEAKQTEALSRICEGLTTTQSEKLKTLAENVEFVSTNDFEGKLKALKESYFPTGTATGTKSLDNEPDAQPKGRMLTEGNDRMSRYVKVIGKNSSK